MKVVFVSVSPPVGPSSAPTTVTWSQAIGTRRDESGVGGGITKITWNIGISWPHLGPDGARVPRVLPCGANRAIGHQRWIRIRLKRVGAEVVGDELLIVVVEQGGLRREERIGDARG